MSRCWQGLSVVTVLGLFSACGQQEMPVAPPPANGGGYGYGYGADPQSHAFNDNPQPTTTDVAITDFAFSDVDGRQVSLKDYQGKKNVVLVVTRGATSGGICLYCATQTSRLVTNYDKFKQRDAEVVVVFPVPAADDKQQLDAFLKQTKKGLASEGTPVPFPVLLDLKLAAVNQLEIGADLAKPATYILDKKGNVRFAHVGTVVDRPSIKAMLAQLDALKNKGRVGK